MFLKEAILPRRNKHYFEMYQNRWYRYSWGFIRDPTGGFTEKKTFTTLPCKDTWKLVLVHLRKITRSAGRKYRFSLQLYTKMHGFKYEFSKFFWGGAHRAPSPDPLPLNLRLHLRFSGTSHPRFGLRPQFTPATCLVTHDTHLPTEGYYRSNTVSPNPIFLATPVNPIYCSKIA